MKVVADPAGRRSEFASGWRPLLSASLGVGLGLSGLLTYNAGSFVHDLEAEFGLTRTGYGAALFGTTVAMAVAMPSVGRSVDRFGPRTAAIFGGMMLALGFTALAVGTRSVAAYVTFMLLIGLLAAPSSPVAYTRAVSGIFIHSRGLALGIVQIGIGLSAALVPPLVSWVIGDWGWRAGYLTLASLALIGCLPVAVGLPDRDAHAIAAEQTKGFAKARRSRTFWLQLAAFATMALAFAGILAHFVPMLREGGLSAPRAGALAGLIGISVIVTRLIVGWLADRMEAALLGALSCLLCAAGCVALAFGGAALAPAAALALGAAMGAEADLIGYLTARHFGVAAYSRAYAIQYGAFMLAAGLSPMWVGALADRLGNYDVPLIVAASLLVIPTGLFLMLPACFRSERGELSPAC